MHLPLVYIGKLSINTVSGNKLCLPDLDMAVVRDVVWAADRFHATHRYETAQVTAIAFPLSVLHQPHAGGRPRLQVTRAVNNTETLTICANSLKTRAATININIAINFTKKK